MSKNGIPQIIAKNIANLRRSQNMTQADLAEKLGYSDKSVSKWERADGLPDIVCLKNIADLFGVTVDYLLCEEHDIPLDSEKTDIAEGKKDKYTVNHTFVVLLSVSGVWLLAFIVYIITRLCSLEFYLPFAIAVPVTALLVLIFNALWGSVKANFITISTLVWSVLFLLCFIFREHNMWILMTIGIPATFVVWLSCRVKVKTPEKSQESEE